MTTLVYFTFPSVHEAIRAEKLLEDGRWQFRMLPVPRAISASCGTAMCCPAAQAREVKCFLEQASVSLDGCYELRGAAFLRFELPPCSKTTGSEGSGKDHSRRK